LSALVGLVLFADRWLFHRDDLASASGPLEAEAPDTAPALACEKNLAGKLEERKGRTRGPRIGTWNLRWFPRGTKDGHDPARRTDVAWLACAIAELDVDVLAVQEMLDGPDDRAGALALTARLDRLTGGRFKLELDACKGSGRQHVGFLWNEKRVKLERIESLAALNPGKSACDRSLRPGLFAYARFESGHDLHLLSVHLDSGQSPRDYGNRRTSTERLSQARKQVKARTPSDPDLLVLGDFNAMGCEQFSPKVSASEELGMLDAQLAQVGLSRV
jgi:endonuclease/exonuclease/phosphatase family metal-dependent hydrolase